MFSADEDARREEDGVDAGIELSSLNWRDSGNESVLVVEGDRLGFPRSLNMDPYSVDIVDIRTEKNWSPAPGFMFRVPKGFRAPGLRS